MLEEEQKSQFPSVALKVKIDEKNYSINLDIQHCAELFYNNCTAEDIKFASKFLHNQPLLPFTFRVSLGENFDRIPKTYIECLQDMAIHIEDRRRMNIMCDNIQSINTDHSPFFSAPEELSRILDNIMVFDDV